jgi:hypothetical protein
MKLWVVVDTNYFQIYLEKHQFTNSPETFQRYLRDVGTHSILFQKPSEAFSDFLEVPKGSCIRLRTKDEYNAITHEFHEKKDTSRRTSSCTIV